ncbi:DNA/RNA nuclease SfsA [Methanothermobacter sp. K4]|uniref:DNA/RNA nuclease SfsA n=1 Tax=Methanothermobacter sp. K4 TaxID=2913262 RepID=UPI001EDA65DF|nr:DNA/RNA nuclease SfsA [Methanothermobacter sp. K4]MCG2827848.1 DNA/RNA nuclease SfsA [Methanothermobacter sp. K4]
MIIDNPLMGIYLERPNRFTMAVDVGGERKLAHLKDPGRLKELLIPGNEVLIRKAAGKERKTEFDVIALRRGDEWVLVNSGFHSDIAASLIKSGLIEEFHGFAVKKREYRFGRSRIDFLLASESEEMLVEVKGCTLVNGEVALFPDAPTLRGRRHVEELASALSMGYNSSVLFLVFGENARFFSPNIEMDPEFSYALKEAHDKGVNVIAYSFRTVLDCSVLVEPVRRIPLIWP